MLQIELWKRIIIYGLVLAGLLFALPNAFYSRVESYNDANSAIENGQDPDLFKDEQQLWFDYLPSSLVNLGLDLRGCLLYTSPSPRDATLSRMPSSA